MFTKNYKASVLEEGLIDPVDGQSLPDIQYITPDGVAVYKPGKNYMSVRRGLLYDESATFLYFFNAVAITNWLYNTSVDGKWIMLGSGATPPTENDYCLESYITSGLNSTAITSATTYNNDKTETLSATFSVQNTSNDPITIAEIGLVKWAPFSYVYKVSDGSRYRNGNGSVAMLLDRTLLVTPVTLQPNDSASIVYELTLPGLTNQFV